MARTARALVLEHFTWLGGHADVWAVFRDAEALEAVVKALAEPFRGAGITAVCGVEARGFLLGAAVAVELGIGFVPVRKGDGMFPGPKTERTTAPDYRRLRHRLRMQRNSVRSGDRLVLVDDWIETGRQAAAVRAMVEECGGEWAGCGVIVDQLGPGAHASVGPVHALLTFGELPAQPDNRLPAERLPAHPALDSTGSRPSRTSRGRRPDRP
ncbi:phosphoribosyltransferase [Streptomyces sp. NBC_00285]|uniref:phosphoribosyltransferase family protein n=1 Tax=Streptomyces sp. NBC_00285 TaxID=2975700 RepID=UPI002E2C6171|nr:phosphoribosyltransferase family protein [Streptomyces sp. NBC_00285]